MTQPDNMIKMTMVFGLQDGTDTILDQAEFRIWSDDPTGITDYDAWLLDAATYAGEQWVSVIPKTPFSPAVVFQKCIMGHYDTSGHLVHEQAYVAGSTDWIGSGAKTLPWQIALCISLYAYERGTFTLNGRRKRGRIYLPPLADSMVHDSTTGEMQLSDATGLRDDVGTWLSNIVGHSGPGGGSFHPVVLSLAGDFSNEVGWLSVDTKLDTQRRREKQLTTTVDTVEWP